MQTSQIKQDSWIFTNGIFGNRPYKVLSVKHTNQGAEIKTSFKAVTFNMLLSGTGNNWRFANRGDF